MAERHAQARRLTDGQGKRQVDSESVTASAGRNRLDTMKQCKLKGQLSWDWHCSKINKVLMHYKLQKILGRAVTLWKWNFDGSQPKLLQGNIERIARSDLKRQYW